MKYITRAHSIQLRTLLSHEFVNAVTVNLLLLNTYCGGTMVLWWYQIGKGEDFDKKPSNCEQFHRNLLVPQYFMVLFCQRTHIYSHMHLSHEFVNFVYTSLGIFKYIVLWEHPCVRGGICVYLCITCVCEGYISVTLPDFYMLWLTSLPTADWILNKQIQVAEFSWVSTQAGRRSHTHTHKAPGPLGSLSYFWQLHLRAWGEIWQRGRYVELSDKERERETCGKKNEGEMKVSERDDSWEGGWNRNPSVYCSGMKIRNSSGQKKPGLLNVATLLIFLVVSSKWLGSGCCQSVSRSGQLGCQAVFVWVYINPL